jgi:hypothetical protein
VFARAARTTCPTCAYALNTATVKAERTTQPGVPAGAQGGEISMSKLSALITSTAISGTIASAVSAIVLGFLAKAEGASPLQPINATSHWLHGEEAGKVKELDATHTPIGVATHQGACVFWATLFETMRLGKPDAGPATIARDAVAVSMIAAVVDYGLVPKRLTPGWEQPLPIRSVAGGFAGLALGLAVGGFVTQRLRR